MRVVAHLSDLHFGREDPRIVADLAADLAAVAPALVVVSGDLTQRATTREFQAARAFLDALPAPRLVVPGNHDVPLLDLARRFLAPLGRFRRHVCDDPEPAWVDDVVAVVGVSTARSNVWKAGRISLAQIARAREVLRAAPGRVKVLVAHHPFSPSAEHPGARVAGRSLRALRALEAEGLDLVLTGHLHRGHAGDVRDHLHAFDRSVLAAHASTAVSRRRRGEDNAYNLLFLAPERIAVEVRSHDGARFVAAGRAAYVRGTDGWELLPGSAQAT